MATSANIIKRDTIHSLGYGFISGHHVPPQYDEYYLRNIQHETLPDYRSLTSAEKQILLRNNNYSSNWDKVLVLDQFNPEQVSNCKFYGLVRIGRMEPICLEFSDLKLPVGLYNSTIISSDIGDNVVISNVNYLSHYIICNEVMITNVNELITTNYAKFGNGIVKEDEDESIRIWLELCNENGGRKVVPFNGMTPGDAFLWAKFRDEEELLEKFKSFTERLFDTKRGYYGKIGERTIIKNCRIIKDVWIGSDAYLKGANKLKNLTINSGPEGKSQIGEGCEMVNGIMDYGCRAFYGVKAVRFVMASHSQLKYGARLINSYLGNNSTISCCEVLNSLIFPSHEQHHNNSFLCASLVMGQSNIAAGATLGSNHNSRGADGEIIAGRGFWPGLCVSLKHNSRFASYTILAKGDYPSELDIPLPFSLVNNDVAHDRLTIMPGYWFMYNMYALERNGRKYVDRDKRKHKLQHLECDYLAPDTIGEMLQSLTLFQQLTGRAWFAKFHPDDKVSVADCAKKGKKLLESKDPVVASLEILAEGFENTRRKVVLLKVDKCYHLFKELINLYFVMQLVNLWTKDQTVDLMSSIAKADTGNYNADWMNVGGQLIRSSAVDGLISDVKSGSIKSWDELHAFYQQQAASYKADKFTQSVYAMVQANLLESAVTSTAQLNVIIDRALATREWMTKGIYDSRAKDYVNKFRKMPYTNALEMEEVVGRLEDNSFIKQTRSELEDYRKKLQQIKESLLITEQSVATKA